MSDAIAKLRKLLEQATPGPWVEDDGNVFSAPISNANYELRSLARRDSKPQSPQGYDGEVAKCSQQLPNFAADAEFIAAMRNALPALLDLVEAAEEMRKFIPANRTWALGSKMTDYDAKRAALAMALEVTDG